MLFALTKAPCNSWPMEGTYRTEFAAPPPEESHNLVGGCDEITLHIHGELLEWVGHEYWQDAAKRSPNLAGGSDLRKRLRPPIGRKAALRQTTASQALERIADVWLSGRLPKFVDGLIVHAAS